MCDFYKLEPDIAEKFMLSYGPNWKTMLQLGCDINKQRTLYEERLNQWNYFQKHAGNGNPKYIENILKENNIDFTEFANAIINVLSLSHGKINGLFLSGTSNSAKSLIAFLILEVFNNYSILSNSNITSDFYFEPILTSSICLIEEPFVTPMMLEDFKLILGKGIMNVNAKYLPLQRSIRIPFLITSNFTLLSRGFASPVSENAIKTRLHSFYFNTVYVPTSVKLHSGDLYSFIIKNKSI